MELSINQLNRLRNDLLTLAHIEYEEVENELLDHYATLTEQKMADGHDFEHASSYAWAELGAGPGLNTIQRDYEKNIRKQISTRHVEILKSYFRWPTVVTTLLIGVLVYFITPLIPVRFFTTVIYCIAGVPFIILAVAYFKSRDQQTDSGKITWKQLNSRAGYACNICQVLMGVPFQGDSSMRSRFFQSHAAIAMILEFLVILYLLSFIQLYRENFRYKAA